MNAITASYYFFSKNQEETHIASILQATEKNYTQLIHRAQNDQNFCENLISFLLKNEANRNHDPSDREIFVKILISLAAFDPSYEKTLDTFIENQLVLLDDFKTVLSEDIENREKISELLASKQEKITQYHKKWHQHITYRISDISNRFITFSENLQFLNFSSQESMPSGNPIFENLPYYPDKITSPYPEEKTQTHCYIFIDLEDNRHQIESLEASLENSSTKDEDIEESTSLNSSLLDEFYSLPDEEESTISSNPHGSNPESITTVYSGSFTYLNNWLMIRENDREIVAKIAAWALIVFSLGIGYPFLLLYTHCLKSD